MEKMGEIFIGTAGWSIPRDFKSAFEEKGSHLERYAKKFNAVEINSSFYKEHQYKTYEKWQSIVPKNFRFSVKMSKNFTHELELEANKEVLLASLNSVMGLGEKLAVFLIQLPPSLGFVETDAFTFFKNLREIYKGSVSLEPRNPLWLKTEALSLLEHFKIQRVFADPETRAGNPIWTKSDNLFYYRLHGSPRIYKSNYEMSSICSFSNKFFDLRKKGNVWCIFDNTTYGFATKNALQMQNLRDPEFQDLLT